MHTDRLLTLIILAIFASGVTAGIYEWKDKDGNVHFGDRPPAGVDKHEVRTKSSGNPPQYWDPIQLIGPEAAQSGAVDEKLQERMRIRDGVMRNLQKMKRADYTRFPDIQTGQRVTHARPIRLTGHDKPCANNACANSDFKNKDFSGYLLSSINFDGSDLSGARLGWAKDVTFRGANLTGADLTKAELIAADFTGADLSNSKLTGMSCSGCKLDNAKLSGADFTRAIFTTSDFTGADLSNSKLTSISCNGCKLDNVKLYGADLQKAVLRETSLKNVDLRRARMSIAGLTNVDLRNATYSLSELFGSGGVSFVRNLRYSVDGCDIDDAAGKCNGVQLKGLRFGRIELENMNFNRANLSGADLTQVKKLNHVSFVGADLSDSLLSGIFLFGDFSHANLARAQLRGMTTFDRTRFNDSNLEGADLSRSDMTAADFAGANLKNANLAGARINPLAFSGTTTEGCNGCPGIANSGVTADGKVMPVLEAIRTALKTGWVIRETNSRQDIRNLLENRKIIADFEERYYLLSTRDLKEAVVSALQNDDADSITVGQEVIRKYDQNAMALGRAGLCNDREVVQASLGLLDFDMPDADTKKRYLPAGYTSAVQRIRLRAIWCSNSVVRRDASVQKQYIKRFNLEKDPRIKGDLLTGFTSGHAGELLHVLPELLQNGSGGLARRAILRMSRWDQPPQQALGILLEYADKGKPQQFSELVEALGARAAKYLPALKQDSIRRGKNDLSDMHYAGAIKTVERLSKAERLDYSFPVERDRVMRLMHGAFANILDSYHLSEMAESAVYSSSKDDIRDQLSTIAGGEKLDISHIRAIATVAYEYRQPFEQADLQPRVGMKTIVFDSPSEAEKGVKILQHQLASRRRLVIGGNAVHLIWWRYGMSVGNGGVVVDQMKKIHSGSAELELSQHELTGSWGP